MILHFVKGIRCVNTHITTTATTIIIKLYLFQGYWESTQRCTVTTQFDAAARGHPVKACSWYLTFGKPAMYILLQYVTSQ